MRVPGEEQSPLLPKYVGLLLLPLSGTLACFKVAAIQLLRLKQMYFGVMVGEGRVNKERKSSKELDFPLSDRWHACN